MSTSDPSETPPAPADTAATTGIQTPSGIQAPAEAPAISLPPLPRQPAMSAARFARLCGGFDAVLVVLVLVFAFLVASFPASNPDLFRQLATGRLLLRGDYHFGVDPFTYGGEGVYWVNHSWLFAVMVYGLYQIPAIGGAVLVIAKALLVAALAEILLRVSRRPGRSLWIPAVCIALAILVISPRLYLQSSCLSFFFLGLTLWLLTAIRQEPGAIRQERTGSGQRMADGGKRLWWLIPPLFALWVNCDEWFFVGPLVVALYLLGEMLQYWLPMSEEEEDGDEPRRRELVTLGLVLAAGLAACLLNPHHVHVFELPSAFGFAPASDLIQHDAQFFVLSLSPLRKAYYEPTLGLTVAGLAYWPLLIVGLASFVCAFGRTPWRRLLIWLGFALLSLYSIRAIPFFAVVAGPITALNWLDFAERFIVSRNASGAPLLTTAGRNWSLGGRALTMLACLALLAATVPGWLQARPYDFHRVGWRVPIDPSLEQAARQIKAWRDAEQLPDEPHWFNMHPEIASYLAWFAPGERAFLDQRVMHFRDAAEDYMTVREGLERFFREESALQEEEDIDRPLSARKDWRNILRKRHVRFWIFDNRPTQRVDLAARWILLGKQDEWVPCYLQGRIAIFAWRDPKTPDAPDPSRGLKLDLKRLAYGPEAEQAPPSGPEDTPPRNGWDVWWKANPPASLDRETARLHEIRVLAQQNRILHDNSRAWQGAVAASSIAAALPRGPIPSSLLPLSWGCTYEDLFPPGALRPSRTPLPRERAALGMRTLYVATQDSVPPESLYLGIRAARRALSSDPNDPQTHLLLGHAYQRLENHTHERFLKSLPAQLSEIRRMFDVRRTQMAAAFYNSLLHQPDPPNPRLAAEAHEALFQAFRQQYLDVAVHHLRERRNQLRAAGPLPSESPGQFAKKIEELSKMLTPLEEEVKRRTDRCEVNSANKPKLEKVRIALENGLAETALTLLDQSPTEEVKTPRELSIVRAVMATLLDLGRLDKARELLVPEPEKMAGKPIAPEYLNLHLRLAMARGDYEEADRCMLEALNNAWKAPTSKASVGEQVAVLAGRVLLSEAQLAGGATRLPGWFPQVPSEFAVRRWCLQALETALLAEQNRAEGYLLRGWIALEAGRCVEARKYFHTALDALSPGSRWGKEIDKLKALIDPREMQALQQIDARQGITRSLARHYLKWLDAYAR